MDAVVKSVLFWVREESSQRQRHQHITATVRGTGRGGIWYNREHHLWYIQGQQSQAPSTSTHKAASANEQRTRTQTPNHTAADFYKSSRTSTAPSDENARTRDLVLQTTTLHYRDGREAPVTDRRSVDHTLVRPLLRARCGWVYSALRGGRLGGVCCWGHRRSRARANAVVLLRLVLARLQRSRLLSADRLRGRCGRRDNLGVLFLGQTKSLRDRVANVGHLLGELLAHRGLAMRLDVRICRVALRAQLGLCAQDVRVEGLSKLLHTMQHKDTA